ncbi:hypothetical protein [Pseudanabaena sp. PCC 6802]|uniref:hypothetical protein n=1 Tax=Pseudanabaena sp. PCC 6802 TaxID=118173 RepID=UPI0012EA5932|nr:hypothetical protein [Pseudanabaena sp. PCC 6802]
MKKRVFSLISIALIALAIAIAPTVIAQPKPNAPGSPLLLQEAERQLSLMRTSHYQHRTDIDDTTGRFNYDCSGFLDYTLQRVLPAAYAELPISKRSSKRPLAQDFHAMFARFAKRSTNWERVRKVDLIQAGDIVAWLRPPESDSTNTGHVMVVKAQPIVNPKQSDEFLVSVIDSTTSPHARDSRRKGQTGLGSGVIGLIVNSKGEPIAYHWRGGESKREEKTPIAFGRILGHHN